MVYGASRLGVANRITETMLYEIKDHLGNVRAVVTKAESGQPIAVLGTADYYPFGMQFPDGQNLDYRYAYQGQEKDEETGMEAFELRLWDARIGRWLTPDPAGQHFSPYLGMGNNPISRIDPDGGTDGVFEVGEDGSVTKVSTAGDDIGQDTYIYSDGSGFIHHGDGSFTDFSTSVSQSTPTMAQEWSRGNIAQQMAYGTLNSFYTTAQWAMLKQPLDQLNNDGFDNAMLNLDGSYTTTDDAAMNWSSSFMAMLGGGSFGAAKIGNTSTKLYSEGTFNAFQNQLQQHGQKSILKSQSKIQKRLHEHIKKLDDIKKAGGHTSSVEREINTFRSQLQAIDDLLKH